MKSAVEQNPTDEPSISAPAAIRDEIDQFIARPKRASQDALNGYRNTLMRACAILADAGHNVTAPTDLISDAAIKAITNSYGKPSVVAHARFSMLTILRRFAGHLGDSAAHAYATKILDGLNKRAHGRHLEMPPDLVAAIAAFDRPSAFQDLVGALVQIVLAFVIVGEGSGEARDRYSEAMAAITILATLATCKNREFLVALTFEGDPRNHERGARPLLFHPQAADFESTLPIELVELLDLFYAAVTDRRGRAPARLVETWAGKSPAASTFSNWMNSVMAEVGPGLHASDLESVAIYWITKRYPDTAERALANLAGYKTTAAFKRYYRPVLGLQSAVRFAGAILK